jgi:hypothetical protein
MLLKIFGTFFGGSVKYIFFYISLCFHFYNDLVKERKSGAAKCVTILFLQYYNTSIRASYSIIFIILLYRWLLNIDRDNFTLSSLNQSVISDDFILVLRLIIASVASSSVAELNCAPMDRPFTGGSFQS